MNWRLVGSLALGVLLSSAATRAETTNLLSNTLSIGLTLTDGNSQTMQANASIVVEGERKGLGSVSAGIQANYGESTVDERRNTTINNAKAFANARKTISPRTFGYVEVSVLDDDVANIDYRATLGPGLGVYLVKNDAAKLSAEAGPSYIWEKVDGATDGYLSPRFAQRFDHALSATAKAWQSAEYLPKATNFGDYLLNAEMGVEAAMTTKVNLRLVLQDKYDSTPVEGRERNDLIFIAGLGVKL